MTQQRKNEMIFNKNSIQKQPVTTSLDLIAIRNKERSLISKQSESSFKTRNGFFTKKNNHLKSNSNRFLRSSTEDSIKSTTARTVFRSPAPILRCISPRRRRASSPKQTEALLKTGGRFVADPTHPTGFIRRPIRGYKLQELQVIVRNVAEFEGRFRRLQHFRAQAPAIANPTGFSAEQTKVLNTLRADFLPRPANATRSTPNLINVFHGTKPAILDSVINGLVAVGSTDAGFFGKGCYTTTNIEYAAAMYAEPRADGCVPVLWCVAAVGICYPLTREKDYSQKRSHNGMEVSDFFGLPLNRQGATYDCHCAVVNESGGFQAVPHQNMEFMEVVIEQEAQILPIAVLWLKI
jgi:hypothetical protein